MADEAIAEPLDPAVAAAAPARTAEAEGRFAVPLTIVLEDSVVPLSRLQGLQEGAVLPLAAAAGALPVRVLASGRPFATGTLVSVGDGFGVLIDRVDSEG
jgi:flagellar motor switch protein FliN/FliY